MRRPPVWSAAAVGLLAWISAVRPTNAQTLARAYDPTEIGRVGSVDHAPNHLPLANALVQYYGGRVISNVAIVEVNWGDMVPSSITSSFPGYYIGRRGGRQPIVAPQLARDDARRRRPAW